MYLKRVLINKEARDTINTHAKQGIPSEVGGFLLGRPCGCKGEHITWIAKAIPGVCLSSRGHVIIKSETFNKVWPEIEDKDYIVVGWYHTHPSFGIFLSGTDRMTCLAYYNKIYQVAIVVDPINDDCGVFGWTDETAQDLDYVKSYIFEGEDYSKYFIKNKKNAHHKVIRSD